MNLWPIMAALSASMAREPELVVPEAVAVFAPGEAQAPRHDSPERMQIQVELHAGFGWFRRDVARPVLGARTPEDARRAVADVATVAAEARASVVEAIGKLLHQRPDLVAQVTAPTDEAQRAEIEARLGHRDAAALIATLDIALAGTAEFYGFFGEPHTAPPPDPRIIEQGFSELIPLATRADVGLLIVLMGLHEPDLGASRDVLVALCDDARVAVQTHRHALRSTLRRWDPRWFSASRRISPAEALRRLHAEVGGSLDALDPVAFLAEIRS